MTPTPTTEDTAEKSKALEGNPLNSGDDAPQAEERQDRTDGPTQQNPRWTSSKAFRWGIGSLIALLVASGTGYLILRVVEAKGAQTARVEAVQAASESTVAMLSYQPDTVDATLHAAEDKLTGSFRDSYRSLINDVVIPGAKQRKISAVATVPGAACVTATRNHAVVLVFVNQTIIMGSDAPTSTASAVEVTLDKVGQHWLISSFEPK